MHPVFAIGLPSLLFSVGMNMIMFRHMAAKEGWQAPSVAFMSAPGLIGRVYIALALGLGPVLGSWWSLVLIPLIGMTIGALTLPMLKANAVSLGCLVGPVLFLVGLLCAVFIK